MSFLVFDQKNEISFEVPAAAVGDLIARIDHDYPPYVKLIPCIYDVIDRKCYNGLDECLGYFTKYDEETTVPISDPLPVPSPRRKVHEEVVVPDIIEPEVAEVPVVPVVEEKKKPTRRRKAAVVTVVT